MKQGDKYFRKKLDNQIEEIEILSDPEFEYLLKCKYKKDGTIKIIHKEVILKRWKPLTPGIQATMFEINKKRKYEKLFRKLK